MRPTSISSRLLKQKPQIKSIASLTGKVNEDLQVTVGLTPEVVGGTTLTYGTTFTITAEGTSCPAGIKSVEPQTVIGDFKVYLFPVSSAGDCSITLHYLGNKYYYGADSNQFNVTYKSE